MPTTVEIASQRHLLPVLQTFLRHTVGKVIDPREEHIQVVFLNGHVVKLTSTYLCLYLQICAAPNLGQKAYCHS